MNSNTSDDVTTSDMFPCCMLMRYANARCYMNTETATGAFGESMVEPPVKISGAWTNTNLNGIGETSYYKNFRPLTIRLEMFLLI